MISIEKSVYHDQFKILSKLKHEISKFLTTKKQMAFYYILV